MLSSRQFCAEWTTTINMHNVKYPIDFKIITNSWILLSYHCQLTLLWTFMLIIDWHPYSWSTNSWISIVLSVFKDNFITIGWPLFCDDYNPCSWSTNSWISIVLSVFKRIKTISWPLLWIICVDYHPCSLSTNSWISIVLSVLKIIITISWPLLWIICVDYHPCSLSPNSRILNF